MKTDTFNKIFEATESINKLEQVEEKLKKANERLKIEIDTFNTLSNNLNSTAEVMVPMLREYLSNITEVRMSFGREVINIISSVRELNAITKATPEIDKACQALIELKKVLSEDLVSKIRKTCNIEKS